MSEEVQDTAGPILASPASPTVRVLLLDDDPANLHLRCVILRQHGYDCLPSTSIEEAMEHLDAIDIAVLDYHLGGGTVLAPR